MGILLSAGPNPCAGCVFQGNRLGKHVDPPVVAPQASEGGNPSAPRLMERTVSTGTFVTASATARHSRVEMILAALIVAGVMLAVWRLVHQGYLPQPFYYRVSESLMDLYTPALWANHGDAYRTWHSLYPPLSFVYLDLTSLNRCYGGDDVLGRNCDWLVRLALFAIFLGNLALVYRNYQLSDPRTAMPRTIAMGLGLPMLYALERGNLLIPCFTCFVLGYGDLIRRGWLRCLALAAAMDFKPYLIFVIVPMIIKRRWGWVAACGLMAGAIYVATALWYGSGWPGQMIANETSYAAAPSKSYFSDLYFATSYWPLIRMLHAFPPGLRLGSAAAAAAWSVVLTVALRAAQLTALACLTLALFRPAGAQVRRLAALSVAVSITAFTTGSAGYAQIFLFFLVFYEPWRGWARITVLLAAYLLCMPIDLVVLPVVRQPAFSWLGGREVTAAAGVSVGQLVRPALLLVIQSGLVVLNLQDIFRRGERVGIGDDEGLTCPTPAAGLSGA
jgi:hypothetical protein